ncbi:MAG: DNA-binding domain-containing protein [Pseudomonadota bacterium]
MTLVDQTTFRAALLDPKAARPTGLSDADGAPAGRRFDVYRNNVAVSLTEALEVAFPALRKLVGEANFRLLARAFLRAHPPKSPLLMLYGADLPGFLAEFPPTRETRYLPDVARLEQALRESYHAADAAPIDPSALQSIPPEDLMTQTLSLAPSLRLVWSDWPVHAIWSFNMRSGAPKPQMAAEDVVVLRAEFDPEPVLLPTGGATFLSALLQGETLETAVTAASNKTPEFDLSQVLALLIGANALIKIGA